MMDENGPKCMKERVLEHSDRSLVAPKDDDHRAAARASLRAPWLCNNAGRSCRAVVLGSAELTTESAAKLPCATEPVIFINNQQP